MWKVEVLHFSHNFVQPTSISHSSMLYIAGWLQLHDEDEELSKTLATIMENLFLEGSPIVVRPTFIVKIKKWK